jgi:hypothetical protein
VRAKLFARNKGLTHLINRRLQAHQRVRHGAVYNFADTPSLVYGTRARIGNVLRRLHGRRIRRYRQRYKGTFSRATPHSVRAHPTYTRRLSLNAALSGVRLHSVALRRSRHVRDRLSGTALLTDVKRFTVELQCEFTPVLTIAVAGDTEHKNAAVKFATLKKVTKLFRPRALGKSHRRAAWFKELQQRLLTVKQRAYSRPRAHRIANPRA